MNATLQISNPIIGLDTSRCPLLLLAAVPYAEVPGAIIPEVCESFDSLETFSRYWDSHWRGSDVRVAVPVDAADPLRARAWLNSVGQIVEPYEWLSYKSHLRRDLTLENFAIDDRYRRAYVLAVYACHRLRAGSVTLAIWGKLLDASSLLEEIRHSVHRLAAATQQPEPSDLEVPY